MELYNADAKLENLTDLNELVVPTFNINYSKADLKEIKGTGDSKLEDVEFEILLSKLSSNDFSLNNQALAALQEQGFQKYDVNKLIKLTEVLANKNYTTSIKELIQHLANIGNKENNSFFDLLNRGSLSISKKIIELNVSSFIQSNLRTDCINALLREEIYALDFEAQTNLLKNPNDTKTLLKVLNYLPSEEALILLEDIYYLASSNDSIKEDMYELWDNAIQNCSVAVRAEFVKKLISQNNEISNNIICDILESSENLEQLVALVNLVGTNNLPNNNIINEICAIAELYPKINNLLQLETLGPGSSISEIENSIKKLREVYFDVIKVCTDDIRFKDTVVANDLVKMANISLKDLETRKGILDQSLDTITDVSFFTFNNTPSLEENLLDFFNTNLKIAKLQLQYGISISYGVASQLDYFLDPEAGSVPNWTLEEINAIEKSLTAIPEGHLIFSPLLFEIQKVKYIGPGVLAARYYDGVIKVAQQTNTSTEIINHYPGVHPLSFVLTHEIGHGLQIGDENLDYQNLDPNLIDEGEEKYSFYEYIKLSEWQVIAKDRWEIIAPVNFFDDYKIKLDGELYNIGETIEHNGKKLILQLRGSDILLACSAESEFSSRWYAKVSPWEDFAEAFAEYIMSPEKLIEHAPTKFIFLEEEFRKYENNQKILDLLELRLIN